MTSIDRLDADLLIALAQDSRTGISELAEQLGVARNTVQARLSRLVTTGVLQGFTACLDLGLLGLPVVAFLHLELAQGALQDVVDALAELSFVLEVVATTGRSDLSVRVAAPDHAALQALLQQVLDLPGVVRTTTEVALTTPVPYRVGPLLASVTADRGRGRAGG